VWISDLSCTVDICMDISQSSVPLNCHIVSSADTESKSINQFLCGLSSGTTARSTESQLMSNKYSGKDFLNRCVLRRRRNVVNDSTDVTSSGRSFQVCGPAIAKARLPTVDSLLHGRHYQVIGADRTQRSSTG